MDLNKAKEQAEDLLLKLRELIATLRKEATVPEREAKREQLRVITGSVQQLEDKDIPIPEDLARLKANLEEEMDKVEKNKVVIYFLREQLTQIHGELSAAPRKGALNTVVQK